MKRIIALILALGLVFAPIAMAKDQNTDISSKGFTQGTLIRVIYNLVAAVNELTSSSAGVNKNASILNNYSVAINELKTDHDADNNNVNVFGNWEALLEEIAADIDNMKLALTNWQVEIQASTNIESLALALNMPAALSANTTPASVSLAADLTAATTVNVSSVSITDSTLGSGTKADPSVTL